MRPLWKLLMVVLLLGGCHLEVSENPAEPTSEPDREPPRNEIPQVSAERVLTKVPQTRVDYYHEVKAGESLSAIAEQYRTTAEQLTTANGLGAPDRLEPGQMIYIPGFSPENQTDQQEEE
ncbi:MAG: LysM peptidoglycan-binding domain-containing protein [Planctomycetaceae bacterium]|nr:LysM peptidoglycan-binding domain-containing protein [Planctomycetaceae bacterium]